MKQKKHENFNHSINADIILKFLWAIKDRDKFYFMAYGKEMINNIIKTKKNGNKNTKKIKD